MTDLKPIMHDVAQLHKTHGVKQKGNTKYTQVVHRMEALRKHLGTSVGIDTEIKVDDGKRVVIKATAKDMNGFIIGSGYAEEIRGKGHVNQTSALENFYSQQYDFLRAIHSISQWSSQYRLPFDRHLAAPHLLLQLE